MKNIKTKQKKIQQNKTKQSKTKRKQKQTNGLSFRVVVRLVLLLFWHGWLSRRCIRNKLFLLAWICVFFSSSSSLFSIIIITYLHNNHIIKIYKSKRLLWGGNGQRPLKTEMTIPLKRIKESLWYAWKIRWCSACNKRLHSFNREFAITTT